VTPRAGRATLVLTEAAGAWRGSLEPTAWVVLEELALRSELLAGQAMAEQSVRMLAESLGRSRDAVGRALRQLTAAGLVTRADERHVASGRFVGVRYVVDLRGAGPRLPADPADLAAPPSPPRPTPSPPIDQSSQPSLARLL
jgi:DNA-binding transcriptional ArsR family regulator